MKRLLQTLYHPRNHYLLHLDFEASEVERLELVMYAKFEVVTMGFKNVMVVGNGNLLILKGPTMMASTLHGISILLKQAKNWNLFINLWALDYPLMPQDDISAMEVLKSSCWIVFVLLVGAFSCQVSALFNFTLPGQHPDPESVSQDVHRKDLFMGFGFF